MYALAYSTTAMKNNEWIHQLLDGAETFRSAELSRRYHDRLPLYAVACKLRVLVINN